MDDRGLLTANHPMAVALWLLTAVTLALLALATRKLEGSRQYADNFAPSNQSCIAHWLAGLGFLLTVVQNPPVLAGYLGVFWKALGFASVPCFVLAGLARRKGQQPFFAFHMIPCLFLVMHLINHYQTWSGNPRMQDYVFALLGLCAVILFSYYTAAFDVDLGSRRMRLFTGLSAVYLCMTALPRNGYLPLLAGCLFWILGDLELQAPEPKQQKEETGNDPS